MRSRMLDSFKCGENASARAHVRVRPNLVPVHELLAYDVLADAGGWHQVVELVKELHAALVVLRRALA